MLHVFKVYNTNESLEKFAKGFTEICDECKDISKKVAWRCVNQVEERYGSQVPTEDVRESKISFAMGYILGLVEEMIDSTHIGEEENFEFDITSVGEVCVVSVSY